MKCSTNVLQRKCLVLRSLFSQPIKSFILQTSPHSDAFELDLLQKKISEKKYFLDLFVAMLAGRKSELKQIFYSDSPPWEPFKLLPSVGCSLQDKLNITEETKHLQHFCTRSLTKHQSNSSILHISIKKLLGLRVYFVDFSHSLLLFLFSYTILDGISTIKAKRFLLNLCIIVYRGG